MRVLQKKCICNLFKEIERLFNFAYPICDLLELLVPLILVSHGLRIVQIKQFCTYCHLPVVYYHGPNLSNQKGKMLVIIYLLT